MQYDRSSAESISVSRPKGLLGALDQVEVGQLHSVRFATPLSVANIASVLCWCDYLSEAKCRYLCHLLYQGYLLYT